MPGNYKIVLGPDSELHSGIHSSFLKHPPPGVTYLFKPHHHIFEVKESEGFDPFRSTCQSESVHYELTSSDAITGIHSSRIPVNNFCPYLVDADCLLGTIQFGQSLAVGQYNDSSLRGKVVCEIEAGRIERMLEFYLADNCIALLFRSQYSRRLFLELVREVKTSQIAEIFRSKSDVLYPTLPAISPRSKSIKKTRILFAGRDRETKGAEIAREVFFQLNQMAPDKCSIIWIGEHSIEDTNRLQFVEFYNTLPRKSYLNLLYGCDISFSPTEFESYGMAIVEAVCLGLAIVTSCGAGMEHIIELIENRKEGVLVDNSLSTSSKIQDYRNVLLQLINNPDDLMKMRWSSYLRARDGSLSIDKRNLRILHYYEKMAVWTGEISQSILDSNLYSVKIDSLELQRKRLTYLNGRSARLLVSSAE